MEVSLYPEVPMNDEKWKKKLKYLPVMSTPGDTRGGVSRSISSTAYDNSTSEQILSPLKSTSSVCSS